MLTHQDAPKIEQLYTYSQCAAMFGVTRPTIDRWVKIGKIQVIYKFGDWGRRIPKSEVERITAHTKVDSETGAFQRVAKSEVGRGL